MNDLNSVYLVGKVKSVKEKDGILRGILVNNNYVFDTIKKEYIVDRTEIHFIMAKSTEMQGGEFVRQTMAKGKRIGVNGRLITISGTNRIGLLVVTVQKLS